MLQRHSVARGVRVANIYARGAVNPTPLAMMCSSIAVQDLKQIISGID